MAMILIIDAEHTHIHKYSPINISVLAMKDK
jgi:hypothetical protein